MGRLAGKHALIAGGSRGIGLETARQLAFTVAQLLRIDGGLGHVAVD